MAPANTKANYKTYEAQARMIRAIVAAHPDVKWNYKDIVACYGSDMTEHALNHRFRRLRAQALIIREARQLGYDMKDMAPPDDLPNTKERVETNNIAKYFGQSTADGVQFQFRAIKRDAELLRQTEAAGGDVAGCLGIAVASPGLGSVPATPSSRRSAAAAAAGPGSGTGTARKRARVADVKRESSDDDAAAAAEEEEEDDDCNWSELDQSHQTPSKRARARAPDTAAAGHKKATPRRAAARRADAGIAGAAAQFQDSASPAADAAAAADDDDAATPSHQSNASTASTASTPTPTAPMPARPGILGSLRAANLYYGSAPLDDEYGDGEF